MNNSHPTLQDNRNVDVFPLEKHGVARLCRFYKYDFKVCISASGIDGFCSISQSAVTIMLFIFYTTFLMQIHLI